mgnify:CR=1 FL=1
MPSRLASAALTSAPMRGEPRLSWRSSALIVAATVLTRLPTVVWRRWFNPDEASIAMGAQAHIGCRDEACLPVWPSLVLMGYG